MVGDEEAGTAHAEEPGPILSTALAVFCYWACACGYTVFLFIPFYDTTLDDFHIKVLYVTACICFMHLLSTCRL